MCVLVSELLCGVVNMLTYNLLAALEFIETLPTKSQSLFSMILFVEGTNLFVILYLKVVYTYVSFGYSYDIFLKENKCQSSE